MKKIQKTGKGKFKVSTPGVVNSEIQLDFTPLIDTFELGKGRTDYKLIHWQGRPKGEREWGIYDPQTDSYSCGVFANHPTVYGGMKLLMLDDKTATTLPSAVLWFVGKLPNQLSGDSGYGVIQGDRLPIV